MEKNIGKVREFCQPGKVGTLCNSSLRAVLSMNRSANIWCCALFLDVPFPFLFVVLCRNFVRFLVVMNWEASCEMLVMFMPNGCKIQHKSTPSNL